MPKVFPQIIQHAPDGSNLLNLIDQYNKRIKSASAKDGEAPPIPIKKRTSKDRDILYLTNNGMDM